MTSVKCMLRTLLSDQILASLLPLLPRKRENKKLNIRYDKKIKLSSVKKAFLFLRISRKYFYVLSFYAIRREIYACY